MVDILSRRQVSRHWEVPIRGGGENMDKSRWYAMITRLRFTAQVNVSKACYVSLEVILAANILKENTTTLLLTTIIATLL